MINCREIERGSNKKTKQSHLDAMALFSFAGFS